MLGAVFSLGLRLADNVRREQDAASLAIHESSRTRKHRVALGIARVLTCRSDIPANEQHGRKCQALE